MVKKPVTRANQVEVVYENKRWKLLKELRAQSIQTMEKLNKFNFHAIIHGSIARGDVTEKSDIDIFIPTPLSSFHIETALDSANIPVSRRIIVQATPVYVIKAHLEINEKQSVSFPLTKLRQVEREFYKFGGEANLKMLKRDIRLIASGDLERLPTRSRHKLYQSIDRTQQNKGMILNLALNYGGRSEIVRACRFVARDVLNGKLSEDQIVEENFTRYLYHPELPDPDLVIRTSGESRISNFLLWEIAYSEIYITKTLWPDFDEIEFLKAIINYQNRERRFGGI